MTEERKQELRQLLNEAMEGLQIGIRLGGSSLLLPHSTDGVSRATQVYFGSGSLPLSRVELQNYLRQRWQSYGVDSSPVLTDIEFYIASETTKLKLLDFIREELAPFIQEDQVNSAIYAIANDIEDEFCLHDMGGGRHHLDILLKHLLKIRIAWESEEAVSVFNNYSRPMTRGFFQDIASLEGIVVEKGIQVCERVRLVPFPRLITFAFERFFPNFSIRGSGLGQNMGKTLLINERPILSVLHKPSEKTFDGVPIDDLPFDVDTHDIKFPNSDTVDSFRKSFCQALSLACNSPVQIACRWWFLAEDELFRPFSGGGIGYSPRLFGDTVKVGQSKIDKAKRLREILKKLNPKVRKKLQIAIDRWIASQTYQATEDKIIDLAIALEALYLPDSGESTYKLAVRASWYLGKDREDRKELFAVFKKLYKCRSAVVHGGELKKKNITIGEETISMSKFIARTQDLCRDSILKIIEQCAKEGEFPNNDYWDDSILG